MLWKSMGQTTSTPACHVYDIGTYREMKHHMPCCNKDSNRVFKY